jgi:hypothetical protein
MRDSFGILATLLNKARDHMAASPPPIGRDSDPMTAGQPFMRDTSSQPKETHYHRVQHP